MSKGFKDSKGRFRPTGRKSQSSKLKTINTVGLKFKPTKTKIDPLYGLFIANGYDDLKHNPNDPKVKKAYNKFIEETLDQARKLQKNGMRFEIEGNLPFCTSHGIRCSKDGEYKSVEDVFKDIKNNKHLFYRPSDNDYKGVEDHPMFKKTDIKNIHGERMRANDVFRAVHDINGHNKSMSPFTPEGEQRSYIEHKKLYSAEAIRALFTETQGQGMWVNFNKKSGKQNRHLQKIGDFNNLKFPNQKAGLFPDAIIF